MAKAVKLGKMRVWRLACRRKSETAKKRNGEWAMDFVPKGRVIVAIRLSSSKSWQFNA
jgi:hypothetical protein